MSNSVRVSLTVQYCHGIFISSCRNAVSIATTSNGAPCDHIALRFQQNLCSRSIQVLKLSRPQSPIASSIASGLCVLHHLIVESLIVRLNFSVCSSITGLSSNLSAMPMPLGSNRTAPIVRITQVGLVSKLSMSIIIWSAAIILLLVMYFLANVGIVPNFYIHEPSHLL